MRSATTKKKLPRTSTGNSTTARATYGYTCLGVDLQVIDKRSGKLLHVVSYPETVEKTGHTFFKPVPATDAKAIEAAREMFAAARSGSNKTQIARRLNALDFRTPKRKLFKSDKMGRLLANALYVDASLVSRSDFDTANEMLAMWTRRADPRYRQQPGRYRLSGILECDHCRKKIYGSSNAARTYSYYACPRGADSDLNCPHPHVSQKLIEACVLRVVREKKLLPKPTADGPTLKRSLARVIDRIRLGVDLERIGRKTFRRRRIVIHFKDSSKNPPITIHEAELCSHQRKWRVAKAIRDAGRPLKLAEVQRLAGIMSASNAVQAAVRDGLAEKLPSGQFIVCDQPKSKKQIISRPARTRPVAAKSVAHRTSKIQTVSAAMVGAFPDLNVDANERRIRGPNGKFVELGGSQMQWWIFRLYYAAHGAPVAPATAKVGYPGDFGDGQTFRVQRGRLSDKLRSIGYEIVVETGRGGCGSLKRIG